MPSAVAAASFKNSRRVVTSFVRAPDDFWARCGSSGSLMAACKTLNLDQIRIAIEHLESLHGDRMGRTAFRAEPAADADRFVLDHHGTLARGEFGSHQMLQMNLLDRGVSLKTSHSGLRKLELLQRNELQAVLGANIHASAAKNAFGAVLFIAFGDGVDPALQATRGLTARLFLREASLYFRDSG